MLGVLVEVNVIWEFLLDFLFLLTQAPSEDKINGILLGFRIRYRELPYEGMRGFTARSVGNPSAKWTELTREYHDA